MRDIKGYEGLYAITEYGQVWSYPKKHGNANWKGFYLSQFTDRFGYKKVALAENIIHAFKLGLSSQQGSKNAMSKLTESDIIEIRKMNASSISRKEIANKFKITLPTVCNIIKLKTWNHV